MFETVFNYITNHEIRIFSKLKILLPILFCLLALDYFFRLSDTFIINTKIKQIEAIESLIHKDSIRNEAKEELIRIESTIISRQGFWEFSKSFISLIQSKISSAIDNSNKNTSTSPIGNRNIYWHYATSGSILWLFVAFSAFMFFQKTDNRYNLVVGVIFFDLICISIALFLAYILALIPTLWHPAVNYLVNIICSVVPFYLMVKFVMRMGNK